MAKYNVIRRCGHEETVNLIGKNSDREWRLENVEPDKLCRECWEAEKIAEREKANEEARQQAIEQELPILTGSEKQIVWAETIRQSFLNKMQKMIRQRKPIHPLAMQSVDNITNKSTAKWWIENARSNSDFEITELLLKEVQKLEKTEEENMPDIVAAKIEATIRPELSKTETVAEIILSDDALKVNFPEKRNDFWEIIKNDLNFNWSGEYWERHLGFKQGNPFDRLVEVGNKLLSNGFIVLIYDKELRKRAINGEYTQECTRWISSLENKDILLVSWGRNEDFYKSARKLPASKYNKPYVTVKPEHFEAVEDFTKMYNFEISEGAKKVIAKAKKVKELSMTAKVVEVKQLKKITELVAPPVLEVAEYEVANEFKD
jgi:hypothetical protein